MPHVIERQFTFQYYYSKERGIYISANSGIKIAKIFRAEFSKLLLTEKSPLIACILISKKINRMKKLLLAQQLHRIKNKHRKLPHKNPLHQNKKM